MAQVLRGVAGSRACSSEGRKRSRPMGRQRCCRLREVADHAGPLYRRLAERSYLMVDLRRLTPAGIARFEKYLATLYAGGEAEPPTDALTSPEYSEAIEAEIA